MKIKVCGIKYQKDLEALARLSIDYVGFNFYPKSKRFIESSNDLNLGVLANIKKVGVFVNASIKEVMHNAEMFELDIIQLHGDEELEFVRQVSKTFSTIKVFRIQDQLNVELFKPYEFCDYFLFDRYTKNYGGSGEQFDWSLLKENNDIPPLFLSGGIGIEDAPRIKKLDDPKIIAVDINSRFELEPGKKDIQLISKFINRLNSDNELHGK